MSVQDADQVLRRAAGTGATLGMPVTGTFRGDRHAKVADPSGHERGLGTRREAFSGRERGRRAGAFLSRMGRS